MSRRTGGRFSNLRARRNGDLLPQPTNQKYCSKSDNPTAGNPRGEKGDKTSQSLLATKILSPGTCTLFLLSPMQIYSKFSKKCIFYSKFIKIATIPSPGNLDLARAFITFNEMN